MLLSHSQSRYRQSIIRISLTLSHTHLHFSSSLIHSFTYPFICTSSHSFIHSFIIIYPFIYSIIHSSTHSFIHSSTHPSIHSLFHPLIHSSTHPSTHPHVIVLPSTVRPACPRGVDVGGTHHRWCGECFERSECVKEGKKKKELVKHTENQERERENLCGSREKEMKGEYGV